MILIHSFRFFYTSNEASLCLLVNECESRLFEAADRA